MVSEKLLTEPGSLQLHVLNVCSQSAPTGDAELNSASSASLRLCVIPAKNNGLHILQPVFNFRSFAPCFVVC